MACCSSVWLPERLIRISALLSARRPMILAVAARGLGGRGRRVPDAALMRMAARRIPFDGEFDVVGAFDVIEHIEDDRAVLREMHRAAVPGGGILLTVPQHPFLWSEFDRQARHVRRYTAPELREKAAIKAKRYNCSYPGVEERTRARTRAVVAEAYRKASDGE